MELRQLKTFKAVADYRSFHKAAAAIHYAQSTVSAQISALEEDLGVRLFDRLGRRITLTDAGTGLYRYTVKMLDLAEAAQAEVADRIHLFGSLTVRVPESFCTCRLPAVIALFRERMPNVKLRFITCAQEGLRRDLRKGVTDLAFLLTDTIRAKELMTEFLGTENLVFVAAPAHPLAAAGCFDLEMLADHTVLLSRVDCSYRRLLEEMLQEAECDPGMVLEFNSVAAIVSCVAAGLGVTIIPEVAVRRELEAGRLVKLPWAEGGIEVARIMIWHRDKWLTPVMEGFMEAVRKVLTSSDSPVI